MKQRKNPEQEEKVEPKNSFTWNCMYFGSAYACAAALSEDNGVVALWFFVIGIITILNGETNGN